MFKMLPKKIIIILLAVIVVVLVVGFWLGAKLLLPKNPSGPSEYSAVYLATGDIYFGKLSWFPWPHMNNVWFLQRAVDQQNQPQLGVIPFNSAFWGPVDEIYLNPKQIIFWTSLRNDSQLTQALANPSALQQQPSAQVPAPAAPTAPTKTFQGPPSSPPSGNK